MAQNMSKHVFKQKFGQIAVTLCIFKTLHKLNTPKHSPNTQKLLASLFVCLKSIKMKIKHFSVIRFICIKIQQIQLNDPFSALRLNYIQITINFRQFAYVTHSHRKTCVNQKNPLTFLNSSSFSFSRTSGTHYMRQDYWFPWYF